jgi:hypothetical protein
VALKKRQHKASMMVDKNSESTRSAPVVTVATDGSDVFRVVTTNVIEEVSQVHCYDETLEHIADEHPEFENFLPALEHAVHDTIADPTHVFRSNTIQHASGFRFASTRHTKGNNHLIVAVKIIEGTSALLKTAYFTGNVNGEALYQVSTVSDHD